MKMDPVKEQIARQVQQDLLRRPPRPEDPAYEVFASVIGPLETQLRVRAPFQGGLRYFTIRVQEHY